MLGGVEGLLVLDGGEDAEEAVELRCREQFVLSK
jgi:hypothetical protein